MALAGAHADRAEADPVWWALDEPANPEALAARIPGFTITGQEVDRGHRCRRPGPIVTGLARLGLGAVTIIDGATVRAATVCRQVGMPHVGSMKARAVEAAAREHNPTYERPPTLSTSA